MTKIFHEIRDPIHTFIKIHSDEREIIKSEPFQRLRYIHQLAMTYLVYPGATHRRFEHSLGVMELADRVFNVVTNPYNVNDRIKEYIPKESYTLEYWRRVLRIAALCHDMGHLPFSHAAEKELLPNRWNHEKLTREIILCDQMKEIWRKLTPAIEPLHIVKLALGPKEASDLNFDTWETLLSDIIVGDGFGVDRIDYLLRDSYHIGVAYGKFDHYRLIDTLRIIVTDSVNDHDEKDKEYKCLGVEEGGFLSAEALLLARYFMFSQVYFHHVRRIYDIHLKDFLKLWLPDGKYPTSVNKHLAYTDNEILVGLKECSLNVNSKSYGYAKKILNRAHFKLIYQRNHSDYSVNPEAAEKIYEALQKEFGYDKVRIDSYSQKEGSLDFPVLMKNGEVESSMILSQNLNNIPVVKVNFIFADSDIKDKAEKWIDDNKREIIKLEKESDDGAS